MERNQFEGIWNRAKGEFLREFGKLTDDDVTEARGNYESLLGRIQQKYGDTKETAAERFNRFLDRYRETPPRSHPERGPSVTP